jgi:pyruvate/2-oxoglutarate/acetoin dehydrogenase E1 component
VLVLTEAAGAFGPSAEIAAWVGEACFPWLDAPVMRLGSEDTPNPASPTLEAAFLPNPGRIRAKAEELLRW